MQTKNLLTTYDYNVDEIKLNNENSVERLKLLGNITGICKAMRRHRVNPDRRIFMMMLDVRDY